MFNIRLVLKFVYDSGYEGTVDTVRNFLENLENSSLILDTWASTNTLYDQV